MDSLAELQRRKAELKAQIDQQKSDLKKTFIEIRQEIEPANLLKKAVSGALGFSKNKASDNPANPSGQLSGPIGFLVDVFVKDPKWALLFKVFGPLAMRYIPALARKKGPAPTPEALPAVPVKAKMYARLRKSVSALRSQLRKTEKTIEKKLTQQTEQTEN